MGHNSIAESFTRVIGSTAGIMCTVPSSDRRRRFLQYNYGGHNFLRGAGPHRRWCHELYRRSESGDRSFAAAGPRAWNKLPPPLRLVYSPATFKRQLKTRHFYIITLLIHIVRRPCVSALTSP